MNELEAIPQIEALNQLGNTYSYMGIEVVPSQSYAKFCGRETFVINQALKRISETGRLTINSDFFQLSKKEGDEWATSQSVMFKSNHGVTLLNRNAVNTLSHYFDDENSVALSKTVNSAATALMSIDETDPLNLALIAALKARQEIKLVSSRVDDAEERIAKIESRLTAEKINEFPQGCDKLDRISHSYFPGMSPARVSQWLKSIGHQVKEYKYSDETGEVRASLVFSVSGMEEARNRLMRESRKISITPRNIKYEHPSIGNFLIKRISHIRSFMEMELSHAN